MKLRHRRYIFIILFVAFREKRHLLVQEVCIILRQYLIRREIHAIFVKINLFLFVRLDWHACTVGKIQKFRKYST